jgi:pimeloyl-ACP methyl ester carboxylesterase
MRDGVELTAWRGDASPGKPTILYFHGNAGNLSDRAERFRQILASGFGLLAISYRGYPGSGGVASEKAIVSDAIESFDRLSSETQDIVAYGESLGTGVAAFVAAQRPVRALVLEAPYTAALDIAAATYPWVPVGYLMRDPFLTRDIIGQVKAPILIVHGTADTVIPVEHGRRLFELAEQPKQLAIIEGGGHGDLWTRGLWPIVLGFLQTQGVTAPIAPARSSPAPPAN